TLDHVSGGRATLGIGAGWFGLEHEALGFEFGTFTDRFEKLEEALQIIGPMLKGEPVTHDGSRYRTVEAVNSPAPLSSIPIMIGGSGEKKTLRMVAQYANESNLVGLRSPDEIPRKLDALDAHCAALGRDRSEIAVTLLVPVNLAETTEQADADFAAMAEVKGWSDEHVSLMKGAFVHGDPDTVGEKLRALLDTGLDGLTVNAFVNGHVPERVSLLGQVATKALDS
ncbi:MAG: LLM class flavin-dependent oxidoreductase, partial [Actinomycetota bacterium]